MSLILKGIDLPIDETTDETIVIYYANRYSEMETVFVDVSDIIQIPKGHGDIKDVGNIIKKFDENIALAEAKPMVMYADAFLNDALEWSAEYITIKDDIDNAPTILEVEK